MPKAKPITTFTDPVRYVALQTLFLAISDYATLGWRRHRQRCKTGRDWARHFSAKRENARGRLGGGKGPDYVPPVYRDIGEKTEWLYSPQFAAIADLLDFPVEKMREIFLQLMVGPRSDG